MLKSMTGFDRVISSTPLCDIKVEIKSVNSRYCDVNVRIPKILSLMEIPLRSLAQEVLIRGKVDLSIDIKFHKLLDPPVLNEQSFMANLNVLEQMKSVGKLKDEIKLEHLLYFNDLIEHESSVLDEGLEREIFNSVKECLFAVDKMRLAEGQNLAKNIKDNLKSIDKLVDVVDSAKNEVYKYWVDRFKARMEEFSAGLGDERVVQEAAILAEKADITEEVDRIRSHQKQFGKIMEGEFPCGKKLDFLCQEMYREWNTIASKSIKAEIINTVVEAKSVVDSIREQIQNII